MQSSVKWHQTWSARPEVERQRLSEQVTRTRQDASAPRVLLATGLSGYPLGSLIESTLAVALTMRGASIDVLICDGLLPACQQSDFGDFDAPGIRLGEQRKCDKCFTQGASCYAPLGVTVHRYSDWVTSDERALAKAMAAEVRMEDVPTFKWEGLGVGEHAYAGALRYFARGDLREERGAEPVVRRYLEASLLTALATSRLLADQHYAVACFHHGIYVPQGVVGEVCRQQGVRVVNWNPAYRDRCFIFSHDDSYHRTMLSEPTEVWENIEWSAARQQETEAYLASRRQGSGDWIWFHPEPEVRQGGILRAVGADPSRPVVSLLTSVAWDARLHYPSSAFDTMGDWIHDTVAYFGEHPDRQLVIRIHPAEISGNIPSRQTVLADLAAQFPTLPPNVFVIPPNSGLSTYDLIDASQSVLVYNTKTGIEIAARGVPVVVAGEAWIRNKGFSIDAESRQGYRRILDDLPSSTRLPESLRQRALKYAYHFFFRRMIPLEFVRSREKFVFELEVDDLASLEPGRSPGLDCICRGILDGTPFIFG